MGKGRYKLPLETKQNKGTLRQSRDADKGFDAPELDATKSISTMTEREQKWFDSMYNILEPTGVLKESDLYSLEILAKSRATMEMCDEHIRVNGLTITVETRDGSSEKKSPYHQIYMDAYNIFNQMAAKFGMNPSDRGRIASPKSQEDDESDLSKLLRERND